MEGKANISSDKSKNSKSLSIIIPAFNEEAMIETAMESVVYAADKLGLDYEVLVVNDGSSDRTAELVKLWAGHNPAGRRVRVLNNARNSGLGFSLKEGFKAASKDNVAWFPGDSSVAKESLIGMWSCIGEADMIIPYMENVLRRPFNRKFLSITYTKILNAVFGMNIKYFNGLLILPSSLVRSLKLCGQGHEIFCELVVRGIKSGCSYKEVPFTHKVETDKGSKAISLRNIYCIVKVIGVLVKDTRILKKPLG